MAKTHGFFLPMPWSAHGQKQAPNAPMTRSSMAQALSVVSAVIMGHISRWDLNHQK